jgi:hypothetical protein
LEQPVKLVSDFWGTILLENRPHLLNQGIFKVQQACAGLKAGTDFYSAKNFISAFASGTTKQIVC